MQSPVLNKELGWRTVHFMAVVVTNDREHLEPRKQNLLAVLFLYITTGMSRGRDFLFRGKSLTHRSEYERSAIDF
jgi:hypothetical protein